MTPDHGTGMMNLINSMALPKQIAEFKRELRAHSEFDQIQQHTIDELNRTVRNRDERICKLTQTIAFDRQGNDYTITTNGVLKQTIDGRDDTIAGLNRLLEDTNNAYNKTLLREAILTKEGNAYRKDITDLEIQLRFERDVTEDLQQQIDKRIVMDGQKDGIIAGLTYDVKGLDAELSVRKGDSAVLMEIVDMVKRWDSTLPAHRSSHLDMRVLHSLVTDYLDAPEVPSEDVQTFTTQVDGTPTSRPNEDIHTIDDAKMDAIQDLASCREGWLLFTGEDAADVIRHELTIARLNETIRRNTGEFDKLYQQIGELATSNEKVNASRADALKMVDKHRIEESHLRSTLEFAWKTCADLRLAAGDMMDTIKGLKQRIKKCEDAETARKNNNGRMETIIDEWSKAFKCGDDGKWAWVSTNSEVARLGKLLSESDANLNELSELYLILCNQLSRIETIVSAPVDSTYSGIIKLIDEIQNILTEIKQ